MTSAARENGCLLEGCFGKESWKVALEPECRIRIGKNITVSIPAPSPLADKILTGIAE